MQNLSAESAATVDYVSAQIVRSLYMQAPVSNLTVFAISLLYFFLLRDRLDAQWLAGWTGLLLVTAGVRLLLWHWRRRRPATRTDRQWLRDYTLATGAVGISWSLIHLFLQSFSDLVVVAALFMLISGVSSSAVAILSVYMPAFLAYVVPQVAVLFTVLLIHGEPVFQALASALMVYLLMLSLFARNVNRQFEAGLHLAAENQQLIQNLNSEIAQRERVIEKRTEALKSANLGLEQQIAERQRAEDRATLQYGLLRSVLDATPDLIFYKDYQSQDGVYLGCNEAFAEFAGRPEQEIIGRDDRELFGADLGERFLTDDRDMLADGQNRVLEEWVSYPDGKRVLLSTLKTQFFDSQGDVLGVLGVSRDITEEKKAEEALRVQQRSLRHLAHHDPLTDLPNRLLLIDRLRQSIQKAGRNHRGLAILFVDLDHFKQINDSLGHTVGDQLLRAVALRLLACVREEDSVARLGGDEFTIVLEDVDDSVDAGRMGEKVLAAFREPFELPGHDLGITTSIGISLFPSDADDTETLLRNADAAMYRAKADGRNTYRFYSADMTEQALARVAMESALHRAIVEQQFELYYQPQLDLATGQLTGCEALVRWHHPEQGLLLPGRFIPVAEETGQIDAMGRWVLEQACRQLCEWQAAGVDELRVAVNLSGRQLLGDGLVDEVKSVLRLTGCDPRHLELEITEGFLIQQPEKSRVTLQSLRDLGIQVAIDDFGTGYSALSYLKRFPISKLKIDYSFVRDITIDPNDQAIAVAIIALAHSLGLTVIAEGVEQQAQAAFLREKGCDQVQGFLYCHPVPATEFVEFWRAQSLATVNQNAGPSASTRR